MNTVSQFKKSFATVKDEDKDEDKDKGSIEKINDIIIHNSKKDIESGEVEIASNEIKDEIKENEDADEVIEDHVGIIINDIIEDSIEVVLKGEI